VPAGPCPGAVARQPDPRHAQLGQGTVVGGAAEATVADHGARHPAGDRNDPLDGGDELGCVWRVALLQLVVGDEAALVFAEQQGVAELSRMLGLALADRASIRVGKAHQPISDHPIAAKPLLGLPQQPLGLADRLLQLADQPPKHRQVDAPGRSKSLNSCRATARFKQRRMSRTLLPSPAAERRRHGFCPVA